MVLFLLAGCRAPKAPEKLSDDQVLDIICGVPGAAEALKTHCELGARCVVDGHTYGREIVYGWIDEGTHEDADLILQDKWPVPRYEPLHLPQPLTWDYDPFQEKYWRFVFYGMRPTNHLLRAFRDTGEKKYRDKIIDVFRSFAARGVENAWIWDKHGTAYRTMIFVNTYWKLKHADALSGDEEQLLVDLIKTDARFLADPKNFEAGFNHGFAEAMSLMLLAENFPDWPESPGWRTLARARYEKLLKDIVGPDGFLIENSTYYEFYVLGQVWQLKRWAEANGVEPIAGLEDTVARMTRFAARMVQPDGNIPMLGASQANQVRKNERELFSEIGAAFPEFGYMLTAGMCGTAPTERLALFKSSGVAVLRSGFAPGEFEAQTHVTFDMGPYRTDHSHFDALNLILYSAGRTLLTDSGMFTEVFGPELDYFQGTKAHNTVTVDGRDQHLGDAVVGLSVQGNPWLYQSGWHVLYEGVRHWRAVLLLERDVVLVLDRLDGTSSHSFEQRWHFPPDLSVALQGTDATATDPAGKRVLRILQGMPDGLTAWTVRGATEPLDGWYSEYYGTRMPNTALVYPRSGDSTHYATLLLSGPQVVSPARILAAPLPDGADGLEAEVCAAGWSYRVRVVRPGQLNEAVSVLRGAADCGRGQ